MAKRNHESASKVVFVKNLPYDTTQDDLQSIFSKFGEIKRCFVVKDSKAQGKCKGFGYVTFTNEEGLRKCVKEKIVLRGRKLQAMPAKPRIIPDHKSLNIKKKATNSNKNNDEDSNGCNNDDNDDEEDNKGDDDDEEDNKGDDDDEMKSSTKFSATSRVRGTEAEEQEEDEEEEEEEDDGDDDEEEEEEGEEEDDIDDEEPKRKAGRMIKENDADEGRTLFIRNLSFDATEEDLVEFFEEFGGLSYCRVVINPHTEVSRGTAFVKFRRKEDADQCLQQFNQDESAFMLEGRRMVVLRAVVKEQAVEMSCQKKDNEVFRRASQKNLHLVKLTLLRHTSKDAAGMSKEDGRKRLKVEEMTKQKLRNPNIFVSETRICVRNIPATMTDKQLRQVFIDAVKDKKAKITECRIMRDLKRLNSEGVGKSKGYAFLQFSTPQHAMQAVLATNNNANIFSNDKRPIVEFSLENRSALEMKKKREDKSKLSKREQPKAQNKPRFKRSKKIKT